MKHIVFFILIISMIISSCTPSDSAIQTAIAETQTANTASAKIKSSEGGTVSLSNGSAMKIPPDSLEKDTEVSIQIVKPKTEASLTTEYFVVGETYEINTGSESLNKPITIEIAFDPSSLPEGTKPEQVFLTYYDEEQQDWIFAGGSVDTKRNTITLDTDHTSLWRPSTWNWDAWLVLLNKTLQGSIVGFLETTILITKGCEQSGEYIYVDSTKAVNMVQGCIDSDDPKNPQLRIVNTKTFSYEIQPIAGGNGYPKSTILSSGEELKFSASIADPSPLVVAAEFTQESGRDFAILLALSLLPGLNQLNTSIFSCLRERLHDVSDIVDAGKSLFENDGPAAAESLIKFYSDEDAMSRLLTATDACKYGPANTWSLTWLSRMGEASSIILSTMDYFANFYFLNNFNNGNPPTLSFQWTQTTSPIIELDTDYEITFRSGNDEVSQEIEAMNVDGSGRRSIYKGGWGSFDWSSDGKQLVLVEQGEQGAPQIAIWNIDTDTKSVVVPEEIELSGLVTRYYGYLTPRFYSEYIYYLVLYPRVGSDIRRSKINTQNKGLPPAIIQNWVGRNGLDVSENGNIAFQTFGNSPPNLGNGLSIFDISSGKTTILIPIQYVTIGTQSWSPDGEWITFSASSTEKNKFEGSSSIWIIRKDGSNLQKVLSGDPSYALEDPVWSPDGKWILYSKVNTKNNSSDIWVVSIDGKNTLNLTNTPNISERNPAWRPVQALSDVFPQDSQITQEEFNVYNAVDEKGITPWDNLVVIQNETVSNLSLPDLSSESVGKINGIAPEMLDEFKRENEAVYELSENFILSKSYIFISSDDYGTISLSDENWDQFFKKYPDTTGIRRLSRVGFNKQMNKALVFYEYGCQDFCYYGVYFLLTKSNGVWSVQDEIQVTTKQ